MSPFTENTGLRRSRPGDTILAREKREFIPAPGGTETVAQIEANGIQLESEAIGDEFREHTMLLFH